MKVIIELDFPVVRREVETIFLPNLDDYVHIRGLQKGMEEFKVFRREFDFERNIVTVFVRGLNSKLS